MNAAHATAGFNVALERNYSPVSWLRHSCSSFSAESSPSSGGMAPASERGMYKYDVSGKTKLLTRPFLGHLCTQLLGGEQVITYSNSQMLSPDVWRCAVL